MMMKMKMMKKKKWTHDITTAPKQARKHNNWTEARPAKYGWLSGVSGSSSG